MTETARLASYRAVLGVRPGAKAEELRRAYIARVKTSHPDLFQTSPALQERAEAEMKRINEAYHYLVRFAGQPPRDRAEPHSQEPARENAEAGAGEDDEQPPEFETRHEPSGRSQDRAYQSYAREQNCHARDAPPSIQPSRLLMVRLIDGRQQQPESDYVAGSKAR